MSPALRAVLEQPARAASVLVALLERPQGLTVLFTERAAHLKDHAGQISFPGGRLAHAGESAVDAALREAHEEIGLHPATSKCSARSTSCSRAPDSRSCRWSATSRAGRSSRRRTPTEVASVFEVPLEFMLDAANIFASYGERLGTRFRTFELHHGGYRIWGATAAILVNFRDLIYE